MAPDDNGLKQGMVPGLELHPVSKINDSLPKSEATLSGVERHTGAELQEDKPINSQLNSKTRNDNDKPYRGEQGPLDDSSSSSSDESDSSESPRSESLDQAHQWSMISVSPRAGAGNFSSEIFSPSTMKPPLSQTMGRPPAGYDPNRIPSSIFSQGPTTPVEWSTASNESLFSIHMGNNSFSRDLYIMQGDTNHDDWYCNTPLHTKNNISEAKSNLPPVVNTRDELPLRLPTKENQAEEKLQEFEKEKLPAAAGAHEARLSVTSSNLSDGRRLSSAEGGRHSVSALHHSNDSVHSSGSFAFPLLVEGGRSGSFKVISPKTEEAALPQPQNQTTEATTPDPEQANSSSWFSCIMCRPRCCF